MQWLQQTVGEYEESFSFWEGDITLLLRPAGLQEGCRREQLLQSRRHWRVVKNGRQQKVASLELLSQH